METVRSYVLAVVAAALLCMLPGVLFGNKGPVPAVLRLLTGIIMACVVIQPLGELLSGNLRHYFLDLDAQTSAMVSSGVDAVREAATLRIKEETEAYILDMAAELDTALVVEVLLDEADLPAPIAVVLTGNVSPYAKRVLETRLEQELGLKKEVQQWN